MIVVDGEIQNNLSFKEDILSIVETRYGVDGYYIHTDGYWIDLGWYPDSDPSGNYKIILFKKNRDNTMLQYKSVNKKKIQLAINKMLEFFSNINEEQESKAIAKFTLLVK